jgi:hypothetical protein
MDSLRWRICLLAVCFIFSAIPCPAQDTKDSGFNVIPMLNYEFVSVEKQQYHAPRGGLVLLSGEQNPPLSIKPDRLLIGAFYKPHILKEYEAPWVNLYHDIDFIVEREIGRHFFRDFLSNSSDKPVAGGFRTTYSLTGYGYTPIRNEKMYPKICYKSIPT